MKNMNSHKNVDFFFSKEDKKINFPSQATENWSSLTLRSGEALNLSTLRPDKLRGDFDSVSVTPLNFRSM